jgi:Sigma-70, region 4
VALNMLRTRRTRHEEPLGVRVPDPIVDRPGEPDPEHEVLLADSVGLALLVVLETLYPAERLAFVLHDMFAVPFDDIAPIIHRAPTAVGQLASRARGRISGVSIDPDDLQTQREVADAFMTAAREGDFETLRVATRVGAIGSVAEDGRLVVSDPVERRGGAAEPRVRNQGALVELPRVEADRARDQLASAVRILLE